MRTAVLVLCLALIAVACGDDASTPFADSTTTTEAASDSTGATTSSTEAAPTTEGAPVAEALVCVIGRGPGEFADIRTAPDAGAGLVAQLSADATGVQATGNTSGSFTEIIWDGATAWVDSYFLTPGACDPGGGPATYAITDVSCGGFVNVRDGVSEDHEILGTLEAEAFDIPGTGVSAIDAEDRTWYQITFDERNAWVAGWFLTTDPGPTIECVPELPWLMTADALGPIELGMNTSELDAVTGWEFSLDDFHNECTWHVANGVGVQAMSDIVVEIWAMEPGVAITPEGFEVGQTKADAGAAFFGRAALLPGPFGGEVIVVDAVSFQDNFTYLLIEDPFDEDVIGTIRINDDGGYIPGGCA